MVGCADQEPGQGPHLGLGFTCRGEGTLSPRAATWGGREGVEDELRVGPAESEQLEAREREQG